MVRLVISGSTMERKQKLIEEIIKMEWTMFSAVENQGGKASCQSQPDTFMIMRESQMKTWTEEILASYENDLKTAENEGRNLCSEKYAYMMESTAPEEYLNIKAYLPATEPEKMQQIREIVAVNLEWEKETDRNYPNLCAGGRPLKKEQDTPFFTSVETYLTGELRTYSCQTIRLLHQFTMKCMDENRNLAKENLENIVLAYGYSTLDEAEEKNKTIR